MQDAFRVLLIHGVLSCQHPAKIKEKSTQEPSKMTVGAVLGGFERSKSFEGRSRTRSERLWCASWGVLAAKLAILAAMLAVLDGKLAAQDGPNAVRSRPRALFERMRAIDRRRERSEDDFSSISCCRAKAAMCLAYQFLQCFVGFGRSQHRTSADGQDGAKSIVSASQIGVQSGQDASKSARAAQCERQNRS